MKIFLSFFIHTYIEFYCILHRRSKDLKTCSTYNYYFHLKKRRSRDLSDLHSIFQLSYFIENFDIISHRVPAIPIERSSSRSRKWFWPGAPLDPSLRATEQLPEFYCPSSPCESKNKETTVNRVTYVPSPPVSTSKYVTLLSTVTDPRHLKRRWRGWKKKKKIEKKRKRRCSIVWNLFDKFFVRIALGWISRLVWKILSDLFSSPIERKESNLISLLVPGRWYLEKEVSNARSRWSK